MTNEESRYEPKHDLPPEEAPEGIEVRDDYMATALKNCSAEEKEMVNKHIEESKSDIYPLAVMKDGVEYLTKAGMTFVDQFRRKA